MRQRRPAGQGSGAGAAIVPVVGVVTAIVASARRDGRFEVAVDGRGAAVVSLELVERLGLRVGLALDEPRGLALADGAAALATYDRALGMLAARGRSAAELRRRLLMRGARPEHAEAAVERLRAAGFLDDAEFARQVARSRVAGRGDSRRRVAQVLAQKGVARDVVDEAVAEVFEDAAVDEDALVESAARKRLRAMGALDPATRRRRLYGFLARRGHDGGAITRVLRRVLGDAGPQPYDGGDDPSEEHEGDET
jgi:regulatory protein